MYLESDDKVCSLFTVHCTYPILAESRYALEHWGLTGVACPLRWAGTGETVPQVSARASILTRRARALVDFSVTHHACMYKKSRLNQHLEMYWLQIND
jgi:hypothetical protein